MELLLASSIKVSAASELANETIRRLRLCSQQHIFLPNNAVPSAEGVVWNRAAVVCLVQQPRTICTDFEGLFASESLRTLLARMSFQNLVFKKGCYNAPCSFKCILASYYWKKLFLADVFLKSRCAALPVLAWCVTGPGGQGGSMETLSPSRAWGTVRWTAFLTPCLKSRSPVYTCHLPQPLHVFAHPHCESTGVQIHEADGTIRTPLRGFVLCSRALQSKVWFLGRPSGEH